MHQQFVFDVFSGEAAVWANFAADALASFLVQPERAHRYDMYGRPRGLGSSLYPGFGWAETLKWLAEMSRKKAGANGHEQSNGNGSGAGEFAWVNVRLDADDAGRCLEVASDTVALSHGFVGLTAFGLDLSVKKSDKGEFMACVYGRDAQGRKLGLSAWGLSAEDAIAGLLVKWHDKLGGTFEGVGEIDPPRRFR